MKPLFVALIAVSLLSFTRDAVAESQGSDERLPGELAVRASGRLTFAIEGSGRSKSLVFRDRTDSVHEFRIRVEDGVATFDGESLVDDDEVFADTVRAIHSNPGDLTPASRVRMNPAFQDRAKLATLLLTLQRIKTIETSSVSAFPTSGRRAESLSCALNAVGWGIAIAASWTTWGFECASGVFILACVAEVPALTTVTVVGAAAIGDACR